MNRFASYSKRLLWFFMAFLLTAFVAGCGDDDDQAPSDAVAPTVTSTTPASNATGVPINRKIIVTFSEAMTPATINVTTFRVVNSSLGGTPVLGGVSLEASGTIAVFTPLSNLADNTDYTATITTGAKDLASNPLPANNAWTFKTGATTDTTALTAMSTTPASAATGVAVNSNITTTFNEALDPATINGTTFTVVNTTLGGTPIAGTVTLAASGTTAVFTPASNLANNTVYTATITTGAKDLAGNPLTANYVWTFTTGTAAAQGPAPVNLGTAGNLVILAKTGISTVPPSAITGDIGVSPAAASAITGFSLLADPTNVFSTSTQVIGKVFAADFAVPTPINLTTAVSDMETAYTNAAGRAPGFTELYAGDLSGKTLVPGCYKWSTGVLINNDVTLNGGPNDVWIFQIAGDLTQASATKVILAGGALPKNIFWQVAGGTGVALGTTAHFEGVILAQKAITLNTGATINGRLLAQTAVTLISNTVTQPAP